MTISGDAIKVKKKSVFGYYLPLSTQGKTKGKYNFKILYLY